MRPSGILRDRASAPRVTNMELFFDLVYVFAVTQLSHRLAEHLTVRGAVETLVLFGAVWWAWNYTAWATNWIDPDTTPVRVLMAVLMLLSLVMSAAIPEAFGGRAGGFVAAYVAIQVLRSAFMVVALRGDRMARNYAQLLAWSAIAGLAWVGGAVAHGDARLGLWVLALALDLGAPIHGFALPRFGRTPIGDWTLAGGHLAERCQLVLIIALGESVLVTGVGFSALPATATALAALALAFLGTLALWWLYFARHAEAATRAITGAGDAAAKARAGYAYGHAVMVAGIIVVAVADEKVIAHPGGELSAAVAAVLLGGPALYLAGNALFHRALAGRVPPSRPAGVGLLALLAVTVPVLTPLALAAVVAAVLVGVVVVDRRDPATDPAPAQPGAASIGTPS